MKLNGNAVKPGNVIEHNGRLWTAVKVAHVKPGKGGAFAQIELRDIRDGTKLNERFRSSETVERVILEESECTFLFDDGDNLVDCVDSDCWDDSTCTDSDFDGVPDVAR